MAALATKHVYLSTACNPSPRCLNWGKDLVCFGARNAVIIYNPKEYSVVHTLVSHTKLVNSVKWLTESNCDELISGSVDHTVIIWAKVQNNYVAKQVLKEHSGPVTVVNNCKLDNGIYFLASASVDSSLIIWERNDGSNFHPLQKLNFGNGFALDVAFTILPNTSDILLAVARDDSKIHLYTKCKDEEFYPKMVLLGHEDWVRGLDFTFDETSEVLLASCSQDSFVRIWRIKPVVKSELIIDDFSIKLKGNIFKVKDNEYTVTVESVMAGHENWVHTVRWQPKISTSEPPKLISASMDKTLIIWEVDADSGLWLEKVRMGDVGGNTLGFCDVVFKADGQSLLAHGYQGSLHLYHFNPNGEIWEPGVVIRGHFSDVLDIAWDPEGHYLLSCSLDKTTRLHAPWIRDNLITWHEIARPQIHGYEMTSLSVLNRTSFISGADEKVIRIFMAPKNFIDNFCQITKLNFITLNESVLAEGASVPSLGLSNKAVFQNDLDEKVDADEKHVKDMYPDFYFTPVTLNCPPTEETLLQNTLWPETQKLYGHGFEIFCLACNHAGTILASACKATKTEYASIILWDTKTWKQITQLTFHNLTVTQLAFSPDDKYLLSVSRDRVWGLYAAINESFVRVANSDKKTGIHQRIIWSCAWSRDSKYFATVSRDKKLVLWKYDAGTSLATGFAVETEDSATAVDFAPIKTKNDRYIISVGLENGVILIYTWKAEALNANDFHLADRLDQSNGHHLTVKRLKFSPKTGRAGQPMETTSTLVQLASCGSDNLVRIYEIDTENLRTLN